MATMPVKKLLITMSLPAIFSMLVQAIYNIVDSLYLAHFSYKAIEATSIVFPLQMLIISVGIGIGVGTNVYISKSLGEGKRGRASFAAQNGVFMALAAYLVVLILAFTIVKPFVHAYTKDPETADMAVSYLSICMTFSLGVLIEMTTSKILQSTGNMRVPMFTQLIGAITNIILDPFFIFGIGVFPRLGAKGAAIATVIGQFFAMIFSLCMLIFKKQDVHLLRKGFYPSPSYIWRILKVGLPSMLISALPAFTTIIVNNFIKTFPYAISVLGVYFKLQSFVFLPIFGLTQGGMPILSYNYGSGSRARFSQTFRFMATLAVGFMALGVVIFQSIPNYLMMMFGHGEDFVRVGTYAMRIISICFILAAVSISITTMMQSMGRGFTSLLITLSRQLVIIPSAYLLAKYTQTTGVWFAYPIAEFVTSSIFLPISIHVYKKEFARRLAFLEAQKQKEAEELSPAPATEAPNTELTAQAPSNETNA